MRATYLLPTGIFAFLTVVAKEGYLYIYVADEFRSDVLVVGQMLPGNNQIKQSSYTSDVYNRCLTKTETGLTHFKSPECKNQPMYAFIGVSYMQAFDNEPRHLDIVMPKYNLSVCYKTHLGNA
jgi:hypothetical protein